VFLSVRLFAMFLCKKTLCYEVIGKEKDSTELKTILQCYFIYYLKGLNATLGLFFSFWVLELGSMQI